MRAEQDQCQAQPPDTILRAASSGSPADPGSFPSPTSGHRLTPVPASRHSRRRRGKLPAGLPLAPAARTYGSTGGGTRPFSLSVLLSTERVGAPIPPPGSRSEHWGRERHRRRASRCPRAEPHPARQARPAALPEPPHEVTAGVPAAKQKMEQERRAPRRGGRGRVAPPPRPGRSGSPGAAPGAPIPPLRRPPPARPRSAG